MKVVVQRVGTPDTIVIGDDDKHTRRCGHCAMTLAQPNGWICNECGFDGNRHDRCLYIVSGFGFDAVLCMNLQEFGEIHCKEHLLLEDYVERRKRLALVSL